MTKHRSTQKQESPIEFIKVEGKLILLSNNQIFSNKGMAEQRINKANLIETIDSRPYFFSDDELKTIAIFVEEKLYKDIMDLIETYKTKKNFGFGDLNRVWKILKPIIENMFGEEKEGLDHYP